MAKELVYKVKIDFDNSEISRTGTAVENNITEPINDAITQADRLTDALGKKFQTGLRSTNSELGNYQRNQSRANQVLFSYGDLINDAQQFQFGFSNGLRAIGNNIGFAAEGISNLTTKAGGLRGAFAALGSSLLGPGGIILAINVAVTAFTVFGDTLFGDKDSVASKAEQAQERLKNLRNEIDRFQIQFEVLSERQRELFPDQSQTESLRQQLELAGQIRESFEGRLATAQERRAEAQQFVDILDREVGTTIKARDLLSEQLVTLEEFNRLSNDSVALSELLAEKQQIVKEATFDANSFQESVNSAKEKQIKLDARLNELLFIQNSDLFTTLDTVNKINQALSEPPDVPIQQPEDFIFEEDPLTPIPQSAVEKEMAVFDQRIQNFKAFEDKKTQIQKIAEAQRSQITTNAISAAGELLGAAFGQSKELAIAQTLISTYAAAQKAYESQLAIPTPDAPARAAAAAAVAVAQGLARLALIRQTSLGGGSGGGGTGTGGGSSRPEGFRSGEVDRRSDFSAIRRRDNTPNITVEANNILPDTEFAVRTENGNKRRVSNSRRVRSV